MKLEIPLYCELTNGMDINLGTLKNISSFNNDKRRNQNGFMYTLPQLKLEKHTLWEPTPSFLDSITLPS
jgi:hypothetical protein